MKASRYLLLLAAFALVVVGVVSANDSEPTEQLATTDFAQSFVVQAPACSPATGQATGLFPFPDLCAECLAACHPQDYLCIQACLNGPCI